MKVTPVRTRVFKKDEDLFSFVTQYIPTLQEGSVVVVTSKIVALAEGRTAPLSHKARLIESESEWSMQAKYGKLTLKDGMLLWNAGIDTSNVGGGIVLLPKDSFKAAAALRKQLKIHYRVKRLGVLITDSRIMPLRSGVVGIALGYAGFKGLYDYRGKKDIFGDTYHVTRTDHADSLATAAVLVMGEGSEQQPLCIIEDAPIVYAERIDKKELVIPMADDMYRPLFKPRRTRRRLGRTD